jgi:hypothetical protein
MDSDDGVLGLVKLSVTFHTPLVDIQISLYLLVCLILMIVILIFKWIYCSTFSFKNKDPWITPQRVRMRTQICTKFWVELISYFPLIWHGLHRNRCLQQVFIAAGPSLPSYHLAMIGEYIHLQTLLWQDRGHIENGVADNSFIIACIHCCGNMFTEALPSTKWRDTLNWVIALHRWEGYRLMGTIYKAYHLDRPLPWYTYQVP